MAQLAQLEKNIDAKKTGTDDTGAGNTKNCSRKRYRSWFFTMNNPLAHDYEDQNSFIEILELYKPNAWVFQLEEGDNDKTPHYQGCINFENAIEFASMKKLDTNIHWEPCKSWKKASQEYCVKCKGSLAGPWSKNVKLPYKKAPRPTKDWQSKVLDIIEKETPDNRTIHWICGKKGGEGKTHLCLHLYDYGKALIFDDMNRNNVAYSLSQSNIPNTIIFDLPRDYKMDKVSFRLLEAIKNGYVFSGKYESKRVRFNSPHIIILSNNMPDFKRLSRDRWKVYNIVDDALQQVEVQGTQRAAHINELDFDD